MIYKIRITDTQTAIIEMEAGSLKGALHLAGIYFNNKKSQGKYSSDALNSLREIEVLEGK